MKKTLILFCGGTLAMEEDENGALAPGSGSRFLDEINEEHKGNEIAFKEVFNKDSTNVIPGDWTSIAQAIFEEREHYDSFVILHGTDTMAYTGSALAYVFSGFNKPIVITGAQKSYLQTASDAPNNISHALEVASLIKNGVVIVFGTRILHAIRSTKVSARKLNAFDSLRCPRLGKITIKPEIIKNILEFGSFDPKKFFPFFDENILSLKYFPGLNVSTLFEIIERKKVKAVLFEGVGSGNLPNKGKGSVVDLVHELTTNHIPVIVGTQAPFGKVNLSTYSVGNSIKNAGALSAGEMTYEAMITKSMWLLAKKLSYSQFVTQFQNNIAGEYL